MTKRKIDTNERLKAELRIKGSEVSALLTRKQDDMVAMGLCYDSDFSRIGVYHLASAELVIRDLLFTAEVLREML